MDGSLGSSHVDIGLSFVSVYPATVAVNPLNKKGSRIFRRSPAPFYGSVVRWLQHGTSASDRLVQHTLTNQG